MKPSSADRRRRRSVTGNPHEIPGLELLRDALQVVAHQSAASAARTSHELEPREVAIRQEGDTPVHASTHASTSTDNSNTSAPAKAFPPQETPMRHRQQGVDEDLAAFTMPPHQADEAKSSEQQQQHLLSRNRAHQEVPKTSDLCQQQSLSHYMRGTPLPPSSLVQNSDSCDPSSASKVNQMECQEKRKEELDSNQYIGKRHSPNQSTDNGSAAVGGSSCAMRNSREDEMQEVPPDTSRTRAFTETDVARASIASLDRMEDSRSSVTTNMACPQERVRSWSADDDQPSDPPNSYAVIGHEERPTDRVSAWMVPPVREISFLDTTSSFERLQPRQADKDSSVVNYEGTDRRLPLAPSFARPLAPPPALWNLSQHRRTLHRDKKSKIQQSSSSSRDAK